MTDIKPEPIFTIAKLAGIAAISLAVNHLITSHLDSKKKNGNTQTKDLEKHSLPSMQQFI